MAPNSLNSAFSLGVQSAYDTPATAFKTFLSDDSGSDTAFDVKEPRLEHPAAAARSTRQKVSPTRTGYKVPFSVKSLMYPNAIGTVLRGLGFGVSSVDGTGFYTHTFTLVPDASMAWLTAIDKIVGATTLEQLITNCRMNKLTLNTSVDAVEYEASGVGLVAGDAAGTETKVAETKIEMSPTTGSATIVINAETIVTTVRSEMLDIDNALKEDERGLHTALRTSLDRDSIGISGEFGGLDLDYDTFVIWRAIKRKTDAATAPSLEAAVGNIAFSYESLTNIGVTSEPYSLTVTVPSVSFDMDPVRSVGSDLIRCNVKWTMNDDTSTPITIVLVNNQASYA